MRGIRSKDADDIVAALWFACETLREERFRTEVIRMNTDTVAFVVENRMQDG